MSWSNKRRRAGTLTIRMTEEELGIVADNVEASHAPSLQAYCRMRLLSKSPKEIAYDTALAEARERNGLASLEAGDWEVVGLVDVEEDDGSS